MSVMYDETAATLFKRLGNRNNIFQWSMMSSQCSKIEQKFTFDEVVEVTAHSKDMQELRLDLLLSFARSMKTPTLVIHVSCDNSLSCALAQGREDKNSLVVDLISRGRLKCVTVSTALQLFALFDLLQYTLNEPSNEMGDYAAPECTLLILDNLEPLLQQHQHAAQERHSHISSNLATKLQSLTETQSVLGFWLREAVQEPIAAELPNVATSSTTGAARQAAKMETSPWGQLLKRRIHYFPRIDAI